MCKEDVRIGRKTATRTVVVQGTDAAGTVMLKNNPDRLSLTLCLCTGSALNATQQFVTGVKTSGGTAGNLAISAATPIDRIHVDRYGELVTGQVEIVANTGNAVAVSLTETYFTEGLEAV